MWQYDTQPYFVINLHAVLLISMFQYLSFMRLKRPSHIFSVFPQSAPTMLVFPVDELPAVALSQQWLLHLHRLNDLLIFNTHVVNNWLTDNLLCLLIVSVHMEDKNSSQYTLQYWWCSVSDLYSSGQMTDLLYTEKDLVTSLKDYIKAEENKLERVKRLSL